MSWFPTMDLRWIERIGDGATLHLGLPVKTGDRIMVLQQRWEKRWGQDIGGEEWQDIPICDPGIAMAEHYAGMNTRIHRDCTADRLPLSQYCAVHVDGEQR